MGDCLPLPDKTVVYFKVDTEGATSGTPAVIYNIRFREDRFRILCKSNWIFSSCYDPKRNVRATAPGRRPWRSRRTRCRPLELDHTTLVVQRCCRRWRCCKCGKRSGDQHTETGANRCDYTMLHDVTPSMSIRGSKLYGRLLGGRLVPACLNSRTERACCHRMDVLPNIIRQNHSECNV